jgi:hypothetical protein
VDNLPSRLQPPTWRSPLSSPIKAHRHHFKSRKAARIETTGLYSSEDLDDFNEHQLRAAAERSLNGGVAAHKQAISRHREIWARPKTPPGYWEISFPDTQAVAEINARAEAMRKKEASMMKHEAKYV